MNSEQIKAVDAQYVLPTYARYDLCLMEGKGCVAKDAEGKEYLDFGSGIGVNSLGWCDEEWVSGVIKQATTLQHTSNLYYTLPGTQLAEALCQRTGMAKVFFANSGAEANEGAIKAARKYSSGKYGDNGKRSTVISLVNSFHGRTLATLSATGQDSFHHHFHPFLPGFRYVEAGSIEQLKLALDGSVCAVMVEAIQGEGGVVPLEPAYLQAVRALCSERDILLIADEIQTGAGRTGKFLGCEHAGVKPDIVTLAKGLGGGLPIGAVLLAKGCCHALAAGDHGSTFGANPISCAGALVVMDRLTDEMLAAVAETGALLKTELEKLPGVVSVTGLGLMLGVTLAAPLTAGAVAKAALEKGLLCLTAKEKLRLLPPLVLTREEALQGIAVLQEVLEEMA